MHRPRGSAHSDPGLSAECDEPPHDADEMSKVLPVSGWAILVLRALPYLSLRSFFFFILLLLVLVLGQSWQPLCFPSRCIGSCVPGQTGMECQMLSGRVGTLFPTCSNRPLQSICFLWDWFSWMCYFQYDLGTIPDTSWPGVHF